jgi:hypothetical protein
MLADYEFLRQLPVAEKRLIVNALWEDIRNSSEELTLSDWDRAESNGDWRRFNAIRRHTFRKKKCGVESTKRVANLRFTLG